MGRSPQLPATFSYTQARRAGLSKHQLYKMRDSGAIEAFSRGLYRRSTAAPLDLDLLEVASRAPSSTLCLTTALGKHDLCDAISAASDIALPRGARPPVTVTPMAWHFFDRGTFTIGRQELFLDENHSIGLYSAERCIIDAFRMRGLGYQELAIDALKRWLRRPGSHPSTLLLMARRFPRTLTPLRTALEILL